MPCTLERSGLTQMKVIEQKIRSLYHSTVFLWLVSEFLPRWSVAWAFAPTPLKTESFKP